MDATAPGRAMELLGRFNDQLTIVFDAAFGTQWAEIEEMVTIAAVAAEPALTTRRVAHLTRLNRRAVSRMISRMVSAGLVTTRPSGADRRAVEVMFTPLGAKRSEVLRVSIVKFFISSAGIAREISTGLGGARAGSSGRPKAESMDLLLRVCEAGVSLVRSMPGPTSQGQLAARQRAALVQIATAPGTRPHDLAPALGVSRAGVAYIVDQLCAKGYVRRQRGAIAEDRRSVVLEATAVGINAVHAVMEGIAAQSATLSTLFAEIAEWRGSSAETADFHTESGERRALS